MESPLRLWMYRNYFPSMSRGENKTLNNNAIEQLWNCFYTERVSPVVKIRLDRWTSSDGLKTVYWSKRDFRSVRSRLSPRGKGPYFSLTSCQHSHRTGKESCFWRYLRVRSLVPVVKATSVRLSLPSLPVKSKILSQSWMKILLAVDSCQCGCKCQ